MVQITSVGDTYKEEVTQSVELIGKAVEERVENFDNQLKIKMPEEFEQSR